MKIPKIFHRGSPSGEPSREELLTQIKEQNDDAILLMAILGIVAVAILVTALYFEMGDMEITDEKVDEKK